MKEKIVAALKKLQNLSGYQINETQESTLEFFFVRRKLEMRRAKEVRHYSVTVFNDFKEQTLFRGSASCRIHPGYSDTLIEQCLEKARFAAGFVKNQHYPFPEKVKKEFIEKVETPDLNLIQKRVFDTDMKSSLNSSELFLTQRKRSLFSSEGTELSYSDSFGQLETVADSDSGKEKIELYRNFFFPFDDLSSVSDEVFRLTENLSARSEAVMLPAGLKCPVVFSGPCVSEFFEYYKFQTSASAVYQKYSEQKTGSDIMGENVTGDRISISLLPVLSANPSSAPFDRDGFLLSPCSILENGIVQNLWGNVRFSHYLNIAPSGELQNISVSPGSMSENEMLSTPHLKAVYFSNFEIDRLTGDFAGELRLGWYYDGKKTVPVTGGSLSGNLKKLQGNMKLSRETIKDSNYQGPRSVRLDNVSIAGG